MCVCVWSVCMPLRVVVQPFRSLSVDSAKSLLFCFPSPSFLFFFPPSSCSSFCSILLSSVFLFLRFVSSRFLLPFSSYILLIPQNHSLTTYSSKTATSLPAVPVVWRSRLSSWLYLILHSFPLHSLNNKHILNLESQITLSTFDKQSNLNHSKPTTTVNTSGPSQLVHATRNLGKTKNGEKLKKH